ncbi:hypothetical protein O6H91_10G091200 [Diphasiastrum complanatum]|uniref:Uncharacterized protein n=1 Tax=Diphasiastrum complanatum TaxID=34168 RepID=A0ACC2CJH3_DIPCM|nr:hypothetical protein O6H91_Y047800 [Diphasiastrum complanatum]KAJ7542134.1 hypothetical protein O6H91_10G091200 [Diphasiastrum complanatum]
MTGRDLRIAIREICEVEATRLAIRDYAAQTRLAITDHTGTRKATKSYRHTIRDYALKSRVAFTVHAGTIKRQEKRQGPRCKIVAKRSGSRQKTRSARKIKSTRISVGSQTDFTTMPDI